MSFEARNIRKCFGAVSVLEGVSFSLPRGQIHALLGQNGAGKSTLVKILTGVHPVGSFDGKLYIDGRPVAFHNPADAKRSGVAYVPQEVRLLDELSVAENVFLGLAKLKHRVLFNRADAAEQARIIFQELDHHIDPYCVAGALSAADRQLVLIARALAETARVIVLDEPTTSLTHSEVEVLIMILRRAANRGSSILYVTHRLAEVRELCDQSTVLRDGKIVLTLARESFDQEHVVTAMTGHLVRQDRSHREIVDRPCVLEICNLSVMPTFNRRRVQGVSFRVGHGEILGICGLLGSGRTELLGAIFGRMPYAGQICIEGTPTRIRSPGDARRLGIALLTEERQRDGLLFNFSVGENITIGALSRFSTFGVIRRSRENQHVDQLLEELRIKTRGRAEAVQNLSGGNQQKLLMARVLAGNLRVLLLDEPTKGVDVAVKAEIYQLVRKIAARGVSVVVVSSDLDEIFQVADRCLVLSDGRVIDDFPAADGSQYRVIQTVARDLAGRALRHQAAPCASKVP